MSTVCFGVARVWWMLSRYTIKNTKKQRRKTATQRNATTRHARKADAARRWRDRESECESLQECGAVIASLAPSHHTFTAPQSDKSTDKRQRRAHTASHCSTAPQGQHGTAPPDSSLSLRHTHGVNPTLTTCQTHAHGKNNTQSTENAREGS